MILGILQARVSSSRLPGKVLKPILGSPMLVRQIERLERACLIDRLIVATSNDVNDNPIAELCQELDIEVFRGKLDDVLDRFYQTAQPLKPENIVRLTGDCPLADPYLIDEVIHFHLLGGFDYTSNSLEPTYPDGLDVEIFRFNCLNIAWNEANLPSQREHVTSFINRQPERFKLGNYKNDIDLSCLRWTVDEALDFELVTKIYEYLYPNKVNFTTQDILELCSIYPELKTYNTCYKRNEGFEKSLLEDAIYCRQILNNN
ncbi:cytidylyltransferase domain-containing protein [Nostoc sp. C117]|uniref:cytidylyltransferase domain-containing protein n=1 Tax=Nostoc sp. C117 TaxID=3349875 RepID=UPI00370D6C61